MSDIKSDRLLGAPAIFTVLPAFANRLFKLVVEFRAIGDTAVGGIPLDPAAAEAMLGPTGNLRAPTMTVGKTLVVGFNEDAFEAVFS